MNVNFKTLKDTISNLIFLSESSKNDDMVKTWKNGLNTIKESEILSKMFLVYESIDSTRFDNSSDAELFLHESFSTFNKFSKKEILAEMTKLNTILSDFINENNILDDEIQSIIMESTSNKKPSSIKNKLKNVKSLATSLVCEHISSPVEVTEKSFDELMDEFKALNEKYCFLSETEKDIVKAFVTKDSELKENIYNNLINENIKYIKLNLFEADEDNSDLINLLTESEVKLKSMSYSEDLTVNDFVELMNLNK